VCLHHLPFSALNNVEGTKVQVISLSNCDRLVKFKTRVEEDSFGLA
jgi:hypothetical protein